MILEKRDERAPRQRQPARAQCVVMLAAPRRAGGNLRVGHGDEAHVGKARPERADSIRVLVIRHDDLDGRRVDLLPESVEATREVVALGAHPGCVADDDDDDREDRIGCARHPTLAYSTFESASPGPRTQPTHSPATRTTTAGPSRGSAQMNLPTRQRFLNTVGDPQDLHQLVRATFGGDADQEGVILTTLDKAVNWVRKSSIWPRPCRPWRVSGYCIPPNCRRPGDPEVRITL